MKSFGRAASLALPAAWMAAAVFCPSAAAQAPVVPIVVDTAVPMVVSAVKPKPKANGLAKFEGFVLHANIAQITARAKESGGYQYGDKVTIYYNPTTMQAMKFKGKPSKPI